MEECFSIDQKWLRGGSKKQSQKKMMIMLGLTYPVYIITSSYNSQHLPNLQSQLENNHITLSFQNSLRTFQKIPNTHHESFFLIANDFKQRPTLTGQFLGLSYELLQFPKSSIKQILTQYNFFVVKQMEKQTIKTSNRNIINQNQIRTLFNSSLTDKQNIFQGRIKQEHSATQKIKIKSVSRMTNGYKDKYNKKLFVYSHKNDDQKFKSYVTSLKNLMTGNIIFIVKIQEYLCHLPKIGDARYCVLMSQSSAMTLRQYFKKVDEIILFGVNIQNCCPLLRGKVAQIALQTEQMDQILLNSFNIEKKENNINPKKLLTSEQEVIIKIQEQQISQDYKIAKIQNLKIYQQFSFLNEFQPKLSLISSLINLSVVPQKSKVSIHSQDKLKVQVVKSPSKNKQRPVIQKQSISSNKINSPLKIVRLDNISFEHANFDIQNLNSSKGQPESHLFQQISNFFQDQPQSLPGQTNQCLSTCSKQFFSNSKQSITSRSSTKNQKLLEKIKNYQKANSTKISFKKDSIKLIKK